MSEQNTSARATAEQAGQREREREREEEEERERVRERETGARENTRHGQWPNKATPQHGEALKTLGNRKKEPQPAKGPRTRVAEAARESERERATKRA